MPAKPLSIRWSLFFSFARKLSGLALSVPTVMIVSRLLTPAQVGIYSIGLVLVNLVHTLRDFGVTEFVVQTEHLDNDVISTAFTMTLVSGCALGLLVIGSSGPVASFYDSEGLKTVLLILSINFFLLPFGSVTMALLRRTMQFSTIYKIEVAHSATQSAVTIVLVVLGYGYYGLAWGAVSATFVLIGLAQWLGRGEFRTNGISLSRWRPVGYFGLRQTSSDVLNRVGEASPDFVIGRVIGFTAVGLFSRGNGLVRMFQTNVLGAVATVAFSVYARDYRSTKVPEKRFLTFTRFNTALAWPFYLFAALMALPIIRIMFGNQWDAAVPILQLLALAATISVTFQQCPRLLTATGHVATVTRLTAMLQAVRIALLIALSFYGLVAVAAGQILASLIGMVLFYGACFRHLRMNARAVLLALRPSLLTTLVTIGPVASLAWFFTPHPGLLWPPLIACGLCAACLWPVGLWLSKHPLWEEISGIGLRTLKGLRRRIRAT